MRTACLMIIGATTAIASAQPAPDQPPSPATDPFAMPAPTEPPSSPETTPTPAPAPAPVAPPATKSKAINATYNKGVLLQTEDEGFELRLNLRTQVRFESTRPTEDGAQFSSRFLIPRTRLQAEGYAWGNTNRYKLEFSLGETGSFAYIKDLFVEKKLAESTWLRVGQWKRPFNRQELVSDFASEFNERANTAAFVGGGRDIGIAVHNDYEKSPEGLEWVVGVFNGFNGGADRPSLTTTCSQNPMTGALACVNPTPTTVPSDFGPAAVARVGWNFGHIKGYSEGDLEGGAPRFAVGLSYKVDFANFAKGKESSVTDNMSHGVEADAMIKAHGWGLLLGAYAMKSKSADAQFGMLVQPGYFVMPKQAQIAGRFAYIPVGARKQIEARAAFNWYWEGHAWKWANDIGFLQLTGTDPTTMTTDKPDFQLRTMLQLTF